MIQQQTVFESIRKYVEANRKPPPVDLHLHTTWTDGAQSVNEMWEAAVENNLELILFSEHSRSDSSGWFDDFAAEVHALPLNPCRSMVGTEVKILDFDGNLDIAPEILPVCDLIMASVHRFPNETGIIRGTTGNYTLDQAIDIEFKLSMAALDNPKTDILGHPFGMTYNRFGGKPPWELVEDLIDKCANTKKAFEINNQYHSDPARLLSACLSVDCPISFGSNAHCVKDVGALQRNLTWRDVQ